MDTYRKHSIAKLWLASAMLFALCFATETLAQDTTLVDATTVTTAVTETITTATETPVTETAPDTIGELAN